MPSLAAAEVFVRIVSSPHCLGLDAAFLLTVGSFLLTVELFYLPPRENIMKIIRPEYFHVIFGGDYGKIM